jgi:prevent-host-death family protein
MTELTSITAREANQRFSEVLAKVESEGRGFLVTKHGRPVARLLPVEAREGALTSEQEAALETVLATHWRLGGEKLDRDSLYER